MRKKITINGFPNKRAYNRVLLIVFLIIVLSAMLMYRYGTIRENSSSGITGYAVIIDEQPHYKPIQQVSKDLENMGAERVANDPKLRYAK